MLFWNLQKILGTSAGSRIWPSSTYHLFKFWGPTPHTESVDLGGRRPVEAVLGPPEESWDLRRLSYPALFKFTSFQILGRHPLSILVGDVP